MLLRKWREGDRAALDELMPIVYQELRRIAQAQIQGERDGHTLQATVLVHEAFLRLSRGEPMDVLDASHFRGIAARVMRHILVDHARARSAGKRGKGLQVQFDPDTDSPLTEPMAMIEVDDALQRLESTQPELARVIEMRFFSGMTAEEIAEVTRRSVSTVRREMRLALAWLRKELAVS